MSKPSGILHHMRGAALRLFAAGALAMTASCASFEPPIPTPQDYPVHGIDISRWQGDIDWHQVAHSGVAFAWIKSTEGGDHLDPMFMTNWIAAAEAGVPRGAYHFWYMCRTGQEQLDWFIQNVPRDPNALPPVLDMEWVGESKTCRRQPKRDEILREMQVFLDGAERWYGKRPVIYTSVDFHRDRLVDAFTGHHFWVRSVAGHPSTRYGHRRWTFWQYTAKGRIPGIEGDVDRNAFVGTQTDWRQFLQGRY